MPLRALPILLLVLALGLSCRNQSQPEPASAEQTYAVTGTVISLQPVDYEMVVEHEEIPGYMEAMTMPFSVRDTNELTGLIPGEEVTFNMIVTEDDAWIRDVEKTGHARNIVPKGGGIRIAREVEALAIGDILPEYRFINEQRQAVQLSDFKGDVLVLTFIFTRCPLPQFCPLTLKKLVEADAQLSREHPDFANWRILAVTIDPEYDTPERLKQYGESYGCDAARWSFLTGELIDITALAEQFGLLFWTEEGTVNHNLRTVVVGADGTIRTNIIGNEWAVETLVSEVTRAAVPLP